MELLSGSSERVTPSAVTSAPADALGALLAGEMDGVIFDGAGFSPRPFAGREPAEIIEGGPDDWALLDEAVERNQGRPGGWAGWFGYAGDFRFARFTRWWPVPGDFPSGVAPCPRPDFIPGLSRSAWMARVDRAKEYIAAGDIYQVNLTHTLTAEWPGEAGGFYPRLRAASPAPFSCFLRLGDTVVLSSSPECFLRIDGHRILTQPIKGTRPRGATGAADAAAAQELSASPKERAELVMITDLERNDLGQVCDYGSVRVTGLCELETFAQVHHLVSTIEGTLRPGVSVVEAVRACYPGGSITGAPKKRAREIIRELEPDPRGLYTGALGFFSGDGTAILNIAIRTLVVQDGRANFGIGAGIVADSDPAGEYEETRQKAAGLFAALAL
ncbi:MAG: aminodeoxychorismate synthase component I [Chthoniobacterales bacterium]